VYLVDTNILSEAAPSRPKAPADLLVWMDRHAVVLYLSTVTIVEIEAGIAKARRQSAARRAEELVYWLEIVLHLYGDRILPLDVGVARIAGAMSDMTRSRGQSPGFVDIAVAATAKSRSFTVLTRNLKPFVPLGVPALDPFAKLPPP
jgi:predicted nucleic acid-binding protein